MPEINISTNGLGQSQTNTLYVVVDEVTYGVGGNWGNWANEGGSSLELIDPRSNHRLAHNWGDSDETLKAPWTTVEATGLMDNATVTPTTFEVLALGEGEWLLDNAEATPAGGANALTAANSTLEGGVGNWVFRGTHIRTTLETSLPAYAGSRCLHIRATARGDSMADRCVCTITTLPTSGSVTLRAQVRWLRGWPEILLRVKGNWMEAFGRLSVPSNLGTPAQRNSRAMTNAPPALYEVQHSPVVPAANQAVVVSARVNDPDGLASVQLRYRIDPAQTFTTNVMVDNGTGSDAVAGDGIFSGSIPGQPQGTMVAFQVVAVDALGASRVFPLQDASYKNPFECMVLFGDTVLASAFATYRQWMSVSNRNDWQNRPALSNEQLYETFVYGNFRAIYNAKAKYNGSPYHQFSGNPASVNAHYTINLPGDDLFLGTDSLHKIHAPGNGPFGDQTLQREQTCYWMARQMGLPWGYRRYINMFFNGNRRTSGGGATDMMEDSQTPGADMVAEFFPDDQDGNLYKLQPWFEQDDSTGNTGVNNLSWCTLLKFTTTSNGVTVPKTARHRWNYLTRAANGSANEYKPVFDLTAAANLTGPTLIANFSSLVDVEEYFRIFAVEHASGNWDAVGSQNQQNMYGYKPENGKWRLMIWDWNIVLGSANSDTASWGVGVNLNGFAPAGPGPTDTAMQGLYSTPVFRRAYLRGLKELATGPMLASNVEPPMDAKYNAFLASGVTPRNAFGDSKTFISGQRTAILTMLTNENGFASFALNGSASYNSSSNVVVISGIAPLEAQTIYLTNNGVLSPLPVTWSANGAWSFRLTLQPGTNVFSIRGYDRFGNIMSNVTGTVTVNFTGALVSPVGALVMTEVNYRPAALNAGYIELLNLSPTYFFDVSGWRIDGVEYTFPLGTIINPRSTNMFVQNRTAFSAAYGSSIPVFAEFPGTLDPAGEKIALVKPGATPAQDVQ
ncbi:MAG TPA: CotH kinase family protein, partial [Verrucomicrobiae bacterium]